MSIQKNDGLGYGQTAVYQVKSFGTTYYNTTNKPMFVTVWATGTSASAATFADGIQAGTTSNNGASQVIPASFIVKPNGSYYVNGVGTLNTVEVK